MSDAFVVLKKEIKRSIESLKKADSLLSEKIAPLMSVEKVAEYFDCSNAHVYNLVQSGVLKGRKIGGILRFERAEVMAVGVEEEKAGNQNESEIG